ncbi:MAG: hypothetical protein CMP49_00135 [Flavobacteriales bacterium]|nr:hypothetical protein [Flavobacteriales bacterium]|tara:strand:- start:20168 stop:20815 length:648 start_codon:yes stop_codon:yes gene_type:complete
MKLVKKKYTLNEESLNSISHGIGAIVSIIGFIILLKQCNKFDKDYLFFCTIIYGLSLITLYTSSAIYHSVINTKYKHIFRIIDHCCIFILIAGTYTPILLISIGGKTGWIFFITQWIIAFIGIILKVFYTGRYEILSVLIYILMGWMIMFKLNELITSIPDTAFRLLLFGGIIYTTGIIFYLIDNRIKYSHFIWHLFVMLGSLIHYKMILQYVVK